MSEQFHEMFAFVLEKEVGFTQGRARTIASYFADTEEFFQVNHADLYNLKTAKGRRVLKNAEEIVRIIEFRESGVISEQASVSQNFLVAVSRDFSRRQYQMISSLILDNIITNPLLTRVLNLQTPAELVSLNVYMRATRSIVTSMGFFVEKLLLASSETVEKAPKGTGWDVLKTAGDGSRHWIQAKSGPNDMDKDQIVLWTGKIHEKIAEGDSAYIGITYGKRTLNTVTIGLMKQLIPDWEMKTLIGRELWDFLADDPDYHTKLFDTLRESARQILDERSLSKELQTCIDRITAEFIERYGDGEEAVSAYLEEIF